MQSKVHVLYCQGHIGGSGGPLPESFRFDSDANSTTSNETLEKQRTSVVLTNLSIVPGLRHKFSNYFDGLPGFFLYFDFVGRSPMLSQTNYA